MESANDNALDTRQSDETENLDELEEMLQNLLEEDLAGLEFLQEEEEKINDPDNLGNVVKEIVWEQFITQVGMVAGEDFIKETRGLTLDLRAEAHIQTTENFENGIIATHNTEINYQERYDTWQGKFVRDENGNIKTHTNRTGAEVKTVTKDARKPFDDGRPTGSKKNNTAMDHVIPAAEIIRDPAANAHMTEEEQIAFANGDINLNEMDARANQSKGDLGTEDWLDNPNSKGQKPGEIYDLDEDALRKKDENAREEYEKQKEEAEQRSVEAGKQSRKQEAFRIGGKALRTAIMVLLADLMREITARLIQWFRTAKRSLDTLVESVKEAILSFVRDLKARVLNTGTAVLTTIVTAIIGPVVNTIRKAWMLLKQGGRVLKDALQYLADSENRDKPIGQLLLEIGKIVIAGMTGAGAILLGETIEKSLMTIPGFAVEIPMLGSLSSLLGIFFGATVAGIIGAIAINLIEKKILNDKKATNFNDQFEKENEILDAQFRLQVVQETKFQNNKLNTANAIVDRHALMSNTIDEYLKSIATNCLEEENTENTELQLPENERKKLTD